MYSPTVLAGMSFSCSEQIFALYKTMFVKLDECDNLTECMYNILTGKGPFVHKKSGNSLKGFMTSEWDAVSSTYMFYALLCICRNEDTYNRYQKLAQLRADMTIETNIDDLNWGVKASTMEFVEKMKQAAGAPEFDLLEAAAAVPGDNKLGKLLDKFFAAIRGESYDNYMAAVGDIEFIEIVDEPKAKRSADDCEAPEPKRTCSE